MFTNYHPYPHRCWLYISICIDFLHREYTLHKMVRMNRMKILLCVQMKMNLFEIQTRRPAASFEIYLTLCLEDEKLIIYSFIHCAIRFHSFFFFSMKGLRFVLFLYANFILNIVSKSTDLFSNFNWAKIILKKKGIKNQTNI